MAKKKPAIQTSQTEKSPAAVALGRMGGEKTALRGSDYFRKIAAKRRRFRGGRPKKTKGLQLL